MNGSFMGKAPDIQCPTAPENELSDVTAIKDELKKTKDQLLHAQKMEAIGTLAGGIAHDFNNILSGIMGYAQLAALQMDEPQKMMKNVEQIMKGAQRASSLVQQILPSAASLKPDSSPSRYPRCSRKPLNCWMH